MRIVEMRVTPVAMADLPLLSSYGLHAPYALRTVVELVSDDGVTGAAGSRRRSTTSSPFRRRTLDGVRRRSRRRRPSSCPARTAPMSRPAFSARWRSRRST